MKLTLKKSEAKIFAEKIFKKIKLKFFYLFFSSLYVVIMNFYGRIKFWSLVENRSSNCHCAWNAILKNPQNIKMGKNVVIGTNVTIGAHAEVILEDEVKLSGNVIIETATLDFDKKIFPYKHTSKPIKLERGVWVGIGSVILGGVTIGQNSVVGAASVVTKNVPANTLVAGSPAKMIRKI
mgnify:CR=1 FL=1|tara:strand:+ start:2189 stop:2728 length:540 start_codon:yes stop_codon:yes gene_type:complete